jgi:hypothetical protein
MTSTETPTPAIAQTTKGLGFHPDLASIIGGLFALGIICMLFGAIGIQNTIDERRQTVQSTLSTDYGIDLNDDESAELYNHRVLEVVLDGDERILSITTHPDEAPKFSIGDVLQPE